MWGRKQISRWKRHRELGSKSTKGGQPRHIVNKLAKYIDKEKNFKAARQKKSVTYKTQPIGLAGDFSTETLQAEREWQNVECPKMLNGKNLWPKILYPARLSFRMEGEIKSFPDKYKLKEFITTKLVL